MGEGNVIVGAGRGDTVGGAAGDHSRIRVATESDTEADFGISGTKLGAECGTGYTTCPPNGRDLIGRRRAARGRRTAA